MGLSDRGENFGPPSPGHLMGRDCVNLSPIRTLFHGSLWPGRDLWSTVPWSPNWGETVSTCLPLGLSSMDLSDRGATFGQLSPGHLWGGACGRPVPHVCLPNGADVGGW